MKILSGTVFGYLILIFIIDFYDVISPNVFNFSLVLVSTEEMDSFQTVFDHISRHIEVCSKNAWLHFHLCDIHMSFLGVWKCGHTWSFILIYFDMLNQCKIS